MATVINNPSETRTVEREREYIDTGASAGWVVAFVIALLVVVAGAYLWTHQAAMPADSTNINLSIPSDQTTLPTAGGDTTGNATSPSNPSGTTNTQPTQ